MKFVLNFLTLFGLLFGLVCFVHGIVHAQTIDNLDLKRLQPDTARSVIKDLQAADLSEKQSKSPIPVPVVTPSSAKEWASIGEDIAKGISATAAALSLQVNEFVNTPVGRWSFALIVWYVVGANIATACLKITLWLLCTALIWRSFRVFHMGRLVTSTSDVGTSSRMVYYDWDNGTSKVWSGIMHPVVFVVLTVLFLSGLRLV